nr:MarR family transcriptional regulator [Dactylosporangium thailandense]
MGVTRATASSDPTEALGGTETLTFADTLVRCTHMVNHVFAEVSRQHGLTPQRTQLICLLTRGPLPMRELGRLLHLEKSGLTGLVDRVQERGLIVRQPDENDRRAWNLALTPSGAAIAADCHAAITARIEALAADIPAPVLNAVVSALQGLLQAHTTMTGHPWKLPH